MSFKPVLGLCAALNLMGTVQGEELYLMGFEPIEPIEAPFEMPPLERPEFKKDQFRIDAYGAVSGGEVKNTEAIRKAIEACHQGGGGIVVVPEGTWLTGPVHLKSNIRFEVVEGAELIFDDHIADYLPAVESRWEGLDCYNYSPMIYAADCENIGLTGNGKISCIRNNWTKWYKYDPPHLEVAKKLYYMAVDGVPVEERQVANDQARMRPPLIQFLRCKNVVIEGLTIRDSPMWTIHPLKCENLIVRNLDVQSNGKNSDGIDPESSKNVLIEYCRFDQGDDAIVLKAGRNHDGWRSPPCENIVIRHNIVTRGHRFLAIGSEMSGGVRNVYMHNCSQPESEGEMFTLLFIKTNERRGGFVENIYLKDMHCTHLTSEVFKIQTDALYQWKNLVETVDRKLTKISNIHLENITVDKTKWGIVIRGDQDEPVRNITLKNVKAVTSGHPRVVQHVENLQEDQVVFSKEALGQ